MNQAAAKQQDPQADPEELVTEEELFDQEAKRRSGLMDDEPPENEPVGEDPEPLPEDEEEGDEEGEGEEEDRSKGELRQVAEEPDDSPPVEADPAQEAAQANQPEWYKQLPKEAREQLDRQNTEFLKLRESYTALHGRLAPVQQENYRLQQRLQAQQTPGPDAQDPRAGSQPSPAATPDTDLQDSKDFKEFEEAFPDEARAIKALWDAKSQKVDQLVSTVEQLQQGFTQFQESAASQNQAAELTRLSEAHPDWAAVRHSADFGDWLQYQPPAVQQMVNSAAATDCIYVLDQYKQACYLRDQQGQQQQPPAQQPAQPDPAVQQAQNRRQVRRGAPPSPPPSRGGVGVPGGNRQPVLSDEELFAQEARRRARRLQR